MAITTLAQLDAALKDNRSNYRYMFNKSSITSVAAVAMSVFRSGTLPIAAATPGAAAICNGSLTGGIVFDTPIAGATRYIAAGSIFAANSGADVQFHDRLAHMAGLSGTSMAAQTVGIDLNTAASNMIIRRGAADYSDVQWWFEWVNTTGTTGVNATVTYTDHLGNTGRTTVVPIVASAAAARMYPIQSTSPEFIRSIQTVQLGLSTGTAGNFGVTATRALTSMSPGLANTLVDFDWQQLGLPVVPDDACLIPIVFASGTTTGLVYGSLDFVQG